MKIQRKPIYLMALLTLVALSSCSQQRYAYRAKVKSNQEARQQEVRKAPAEETLTQVEPASEETPETIMTPAPETPSVAPEARAVKPARVAKKLLSKETRTQLVELAKDPVAVQDLLEKQQITSQEDTTLQPDIDTNNKWVKMMIIGLILVVIGVILNFTIILSPIGWILSFVGSILFLVGLLMFLFEML